MENDQYLYEFLMENADRISQEWYYTLDQNDEKSVSVLTSTTVLEEFKNRNLTFVILLNRIYNNQEDYFYSKINHWAKSIAEEQEHQNTPIYIIIKEFTRLRNLYLSYIKDYARKYPEEISLEKMGEWRDRLLKALDYSINMFVKESFLSSERQLLAQKQMIYELSSPVILLHKGAALLPLIGDIDISRAKVIMESTLHQCIEKHVNHLFLDLSGVLMIDTMVAHQLSQLMTALKLVGVNTTISGIRPEIAQTSVHLGILFEGITVKSTLAHAIADTLETMK